MSFDSCIWVRWLCFRDRQRENIHRQKRIRHRTEWLLFRIITSSGPEIKHQIRRNLLRMRSPVYLPVNLLHFKRMAVCCVVIVCGTAKPDWNRPPNILVINFGKFLQLWFSEAILVCVYMKYNYVNRMEPALTNSLWFNCQRTFVNE